MTLGSEKYGLSSVSVEKQTLGKSDKSNKLVVDFNDLVYNWIFLFFKKNSMDQIQIF